MKLKTNSSIHKMNLFFAFEKECEMNLHTSKCPLKQKQKKFCEENILFGC